MVRLDQRAKVGDRAADAKVVALGRDERHAYVVRGGGIGSVRGGWLEQLRHGGVPNSLASLALGVSSRPERPRRAPEEPSLHEPSSGAAQTGAALWPVPRHERNLR